MNDLDRRVICVSKEEPENPTPSAPELVSIVTAWSPAKLCTEEEEDDVALRELQELLDEPFPSGSKGVEVKSQPKVVGMSAKGSKKIGLRSKSRDQRVNSYNKIIESQERLNEFHINIILLFFINH